MNRLFGFRQFLGLFLGALLGLTYGAVSQFINSVVLPGVPLYQPPLGAWGNLILLTAVGAILGWGVAIPVSSGLAIILVSGSLALIAMFANATQMKFESGAWFTIFISAVFFAVPIFGLLVPVFGLYRWAVNKAESRYEPMGWRIGAPLLLLVVAGAIAAISLLPDEGRLVLSRMNGLLQSGMASANAAALPQPLQSELVQDFPNSARGPYTLEWRVQDLNRYAIPRPSIDPRFESGAIARFDNGYTVVCIFPTMTSEPSCKGF